MVYFDATDEGASARAWHRSKFNFDKVSMPNFLQSGNGDRGPVDMKDGYHVHSSTFCIICNGNTRLYYFYNTLIKFDLLKSAGSEMPPNTGHGVSSDGSHIAETSPRKRDKRGSNRKSGGEFAGSESIDEVARGKEGQDCRSDREEGSG